MPAPAGGGWQGAETALVSRGTTAPLSRTSNTFPQWLGISNVDNLFLTTQTSADTGSTIWHTYSAFMAPPLASPPPSWQAAGPARRNSVTYRLGIHVL